MNEETNANINTTTETKTSTKCTLREEEVRLLSDDDLRASMVENYKQRWSARKLVDECEDKEEVRWLEYKKRIVQSMSREALEECKVYGVVEDSEDAETWWVETFLVPVLKSYGVYESRYRGRELTALEKEQLEAYESKVER
jgi:hypothetical protein